MSDKQELRELLENAIKNDDVTLRDNVLAEMSNRGIKHTYPTFLAIARDMLKRNEGPKLANLLREVPSLISTVLHEEALNFAVHNGHLRGAEIVLDAMDAASQKPSTYAANKVLDLILKDRGLEGGKKHLERIHRWGVANAFTYKLLVRDSDFKYANELLGDMKAKGIAVTTDVMNRYLYSVFVSGDSEGCLRVLQQMKDQGPPPDIESYTTCMRSQKSNLSKCRELFDEATARGLKPEPLMWSVMLVSAMNNEDAGAFDEFIARMRAQGGTLTPSGHAAHILREFARERYAACARAIEDALRHKMVDSRLLSQFFAEVSKKADVHAKWAMDNKWINNADQLRSFVTRNQGLDFVRALARDQKSSASQ